MHQLSNHHDRQGLMPSKHKRSPQVNTPRSPCFHHAPIPWCLTYPAQRASTRDSQPTRRVKRNRNCKTHGWQDRLVLLALFDAYISFVFDRVRRPRSRPPTSMQHAPTPPVAQPQPDRRPPEHRRIFGNAARALYMFCMSAACHTLTNWVTVGKANAATEFRFFFSNYAVCLVEAAFAKGLMGWREEARSVEMRFPFLRRLVGHIWVSAILFSLAPGLAVFPVTCCAGTLNAT